MACALLTSSLLECIGLKRANICILEWQSQGSRRCDSLVNDLSSIEIDGGGVGISKIKKGFTGGSKKRGGHSLIPKFLRRQDQTPRFCPTCGAVLDPSFAPSEQCPQCKEAVIPVEQASRVAVTSIQEKAIDRVGGDMQGVAIILFANRNN